MIQNNFKQLAERIGKSQSAIAKEAGLPATVLSGVFSGKTVLEQDELERVCKALGSTPESVYPANILEALYGTSEVSAKKERNTVSVRLKKETTEWIDSLVEKGIYDSRNEAVNRLLNSKKNTGSGWNDVE